MYLVKSLLLVSILFVNLISYQDPYVEKILLEEIKRKYKKFAKKRFFYLQQTLNYLSKVSDLEKLKAVNDFFNDVKYSTDEKIYKRSDYWATPWEFLGKDNGDCEDYVISKYFALVYLGIDAKKLFLTYVRSSKFNTPHMVLTYFKTPRAEPLILDNNNRRVFLASKRKDLIPIYNFNPNSLKKSKKKKSHKNWDELKENMRKKRI